MKLSLPKKQPVNDRLKLENPKMAQVKQKSVYRRLFQP